MTPPPPSESSLALGFEEWFLDWWEQRRMSPWRVRVFLDEPIEEGSRVLLQVMPDHEGRAAAQGGSSPREERGKENCVCFMSERLTKESALVLRPVLSMVRKTLGLDAREGMGFLFFMFLIGFDRHGVLTDGRDSVLCEGSWKRRGIRAVAELDDMPDNLPEPQVSTQAILFNWGGFRRGFIEAAEGSQRRLHDSLSFLSIPPRDLVTGDASLGSSEGGLQRAIRSLARVIPEIVFQRSMPGIRPVGDLQRMVGPALERAAEEPHGAEATEPNQMTSLAAQVNRGTPLTGESGAPISPTDAVGKRSAFRFQKEGGLWNIAYEEKEWMSQPDDYLGFECIHFLLGRARNPVPVQEVLRVLDRTPPTSTQVAPESTAVSELKHDGLVVTQSPDALDEPLIDPQTLNEIRRRRQELFRLEEEAEKYGWQEKLNAFRSEREELEKYIKSSVGVGGRIRKEPRKLNSDRARLYGLLDRAYTRLGQLSKSMEAHLRKYIRQGASCSYEPETEIEWQL